MLFIIILLSLACIIISYFYQNGHLFSSRTINSLPGPIRLPFIGNLFYFVQQTTQETKGFLHNVTQLCENYSSPLQIRIGPKPFIIIYEPDQVQVILQSRNCLDKSMLYKIVKPVLGAGLLTAPACTWIKNRKTIAPIFNATMVRKYFDIFVRESLIMTKEFEKTGQFGNEIIFLEHIETCTIRISCDTMMGAKMKPHMIEQCLKEIQRMKRIMKIRLSHAYLVPDIIFNLTSLKHEQQKTVNFGHSIVAELLKQRTGNKSTNDDISFERFFDIFMNSSCNNNCTQKEIAEHILTMLMTSIDTIAVTMHFVIFMLANFFKIQEKVYKELLEIYGTETPESSPVQYEDLQRMNYLDCVIKETLRLFPTVPLIGRQLTEDLEIENIVLPKGTDVLLSFIQMHRSKKYWPNPLMFDPDRFLQEKTRNCQLNYYVPFSGGPRNCIGMKYAMMSMKVILATLIRTFVFKVNQNLEIGEIKLNVDLVLSTLKPLKIKVEKRNIK